MPYVDGFIVPVPKKNLEAYRRLARKAGKVWREHGALDFKECVADDVKKGKWTSFPRSVKLKPSETVVFSWITYKSRAHRDRVNAKVMKDKRIAGDGHESDAVRRQAHDLWRLQGHRQRLRRAQPSTRPTAAPPYRRRHRMDAGPVCRLLSANAGCVQADIKRREAFVFDRYVNHLFRHPLYRLPVMPSSFSGRRCRKAGRQNVDRVVISVAIAAVLAGTAPAFSEFRACFGPCDQRRIDHPGEESCRAERKMVRGKSEHRAHLRVARLPFRRQRATDL